MPKQLAPLVAEVEADPRFRHTFHYLPTRFAMVELDKLVVYQSSLTKSWADGVAAKLGPRAELETVFRACYPIAVDPPPLKVEAADDDRFLFNSPASHLSFHEAVMLEPGRVPSYASYGPVGGIVGLVVGFRGNFLNCIKADDRILLNNGCHRAYALRSLGYQKFGFYRGTVRSISRAAINPAEFSSGVAGLTSLFGEGEPVYRIRVDLERQTVTAYGEAVPLQAGLAVEADIMLETRRLIEWVLDPLYTLTGRS